MEAWRAMVAHNGGVKDQNGALEGLYTSGRRFASVCWESGSRSTLQWKVGSGSTLKCRGSIDTNWPATPVEQKNCYCSAGELKVLLLTVPVHQHATISRTLEQIADICQTVKQTVAFCPPLQHYAALPLVDQRSKTLLPLVHWSKKCCIWPAKEAKMLPLGASKAKCCYSRVYVRFIASNIHILYAFGILYQGQAPDSPYNQKAHIF